MLPLHEPLPITTYCHQATDKAEAWAPQHTTACCYPIPLLPPGSVASVTILRRHAGSPVCHAITDSDKNSQYMTVALCTQDQP